MRRLHTRSTRTDTLVPYAALVRSYAALESLTSNADVLWKVPLAVAALALSYASLAVAISSFATRRIVAAAALLIVLLVTSITAAVLTEGRSTGTGWAAINLLNNPLQVRDLIFEGQILPESDLADRKSKRLNSSH